MTTCQPQSRKPFLKLGSDLQHEPKALSGCSVTAHLHPHNLLPGWYKPWQWQAQLLHPNPPAAASIHTETNVISGKRTRITSARSDCYLTLHWTQFKLLNLTEDKVFEFLLKWSEAQIRTQYRRTSSTYYVRSIDFFSCHSYSYKRKIKTFQSTPLKRII